VTRRAGGQWLQNQAAESAAGSRDEGAADEVDQVDYLKEGNGGGTAVVALYNYSAEPEPPFLPDPHSELDLARGDVLFLLHKREEDGWCLCRQRDGRDGAPAIVGWAPGNFISSDGQHALVVADAP
jgi:hypothetical protein